MHAQLVQRRPHVGEEVGTARGRAEVESEGDPFLRLGEIKKLKHAFRCYVQICSALLCNSVVCGSVFSQHYYTRVTFHVVLVKGESI